MPRGPTHMKKPHALKRIRRWLESWHEWPLSHVSRAAYWLRTHTYDRYHMLDIRNKRNGYAWGWIDRSEGILFANMAVLSEFVERERGLDGIVDWDSDESHAAAKKELLEIYRWWTHDRKIEHDRYDALFSRAYARPLEFEPIGNGMSRFKKDTLTKEEKELRYQCSLMEEALEAKDEEMMIRLIKIRGCMWT